MELSNFFIMFLILFSILASGNGVGASSRLHKHRRNKKDAFEPKKLFVFGDSYADTGNGGYDGASWNLPYGQTYPGQPAGRYSDGRVFTDIVAEHYGLKTPPASRFVNGSSDQVLDGVNFAYGGTGVFDTGIESPNMTAQIDSLKKLLNNSVITKADLESSMCILSVFGNDYGAFLLNGGKIQDLLTFIQSVVSQIAKNMKTLHDLGAKKTVVANMAPGGCIPLLADSSTECNKTLNIFVAVHNSLLNETVENLEKESGDSSYYVLDSYNMFFKAYTSSGNFKTPFKACCEQCGTNASRVCDDPNSAFYWDVVHPTNAGWLAVYDQFLKPALKNIK